MFQDLIKKEFPNKVFDRSERNESIFSAILNNEGMMELVMGIIGPHLYEKFKSGKAKEG